MCLVDHVMTKWLCFLAVDASSSQRELSVMTQRASHQEQNHPYCQFLHQLSCPVQEFQLGICVHVWERK